MARYVQFLGYPFEEQVKPCKLAWGAIGSEFASRHQDEMSDAGAPFVAKGYTLSRYAPDGPAAGAHGVGPGGSGFVETCAAAVDPAEQAPRRRERHHDVTLIDPDRRPPHDDLPSDHNALLSPP